MNQLWTIGTIIKQMREKQHISQQQLCRGLCSAATLSRVESGEREMNFLLYSRIFQRLGYQPDKYEFYGSPEELIQWEQRYTMMSDYRTGDYIQLQSHLDLYKEQWKKEIGKDVLQLQFIQWMQGMLLLKGGDFKASTIILDQALSQTVPFWNEYSEADLIFGETELEIMNLCGEVSCKDGELDKAGRIYQRILDFLEGYPQRKEEMCHLYTEVVCKVAPLYLEKHHPEAAYELCQNGLNTLSRCLKITHWPDLLYWKGRSLEEKQKGFLWPQSQITKEIIEVYKRTYYIYRLFGNEQEAAQILMRLQEEYGWECTTLEK